MVPVYPLFLPHVVLSFTTVAGFLNYELSFNYLLLSVILIGAENWEKWLFLKLLHFDYLLKANNF